ncbi:hypothetical protein H4R34_004987 [Dimargaris verticillata]|uniref:Peptidase S8/S53 domain-containing protein n=1 Tax=Dimargaris verticillata TaxID=2761393 RepID=A0A9W8B3T6_9FUNG|nr:hypothetical protein H4R34_004987 [Dimargaris verticillata]
MVVLLSRIQGAAGWASAALFIGAAMLPLGQAGLIDQQRGALPNQYIVQFDPSQLNTGAQTREFHNRVSSALHIVGDTLSTPTVAFKVIKDMDHTLFKGSVIQLDDMNVNKIRQMDEVVGIWPNHVYSVPKTAKNPQDAKGRNMAAAPLPARPFNVHNMTGVDKLQEMGYTGRGIKVAIIDTGLYYHHPAFDSCYDQPGCRILPGYDFVGNDFDALNPNSLPQPDDDPLSECQSHGTHVAGIIGGHNGTFVGVAPGVELTPYKIFGCGENAGTSDESIIAALNKAYEDGNDIISLSVGGWGGFADSPSAVVATQIAGNGTLVVIAAGNFGEETLWTASSPSTGTGAISVGSVDALQRYATQLVVHGNAGNHAFECNGHQAPAPVFDMVKTPLMRYGDDDADLIACTNLGSDFAGAVVVVKRGTCNYQAKVTNAMNQGASGIIIIGTAETGVPISVAIERSDIPIATVSHTTGTKILNLIDNEPNLQVSADAELALIDSLTGGQISFFSSYGPGYSLDIKPEILAPGGDIYSTVTLADGLYASMSGTSMAAPYITGCLALLLEVGIPKKPDYIKQLLMTTADPVKATTEMGLATVAHQGGGLVNLVRALQAFHQVTPGKLVLLDPAYGGFVNGKVTKDLRVANHGQTSVTYDLTAVSAVSVSAFNATNHTTLPIFGGDGPRIELHPFQITLGAGEAANVKVTITQPSASLRPFLVYSGFVQATVAGGADLAWSVPLMGFNTEYQTMPFFTPGDTPNPALYSSATSQPLVTNNAEAFTMNDRSFPAYYMDVQFPLGPWQLYVADAATPDQAVAIVEAGQGYSRDSIGDPTQPASTWYGEGTDRDGKTFAVPNGQYVFGFAYTSPLGDLNRPTDRMLWTSPPFMVNRA